MANAFRLTPDGSLDREYLRICAVHRCVTRYGRDVNWTIRNLAPRFMRSEKAQQMFELWNRKSRLTTSGGCGLPYNLGE